MMLSKYPIYFKLINEEDAYGFVGHFLFSFIRYAVMIKKEGGINLFEIHLGFTYYTNIRLRFEINDLGDWI